MDFYDVIGDIHGQYQLLKKLLTHLGYVPINGTWKHPERRQVIFLGDLIDRGPEPCEVINTVRGMVDGGSAYCIMGNHEYNAIRWTMPDPNCLGEFLRKHTKKNIKQHQSTLKDIKENSKRHKEYIDWFKTLPLWLELGNSRFIHACWDETSIRTLQQETKNGLIQDDDFFIKASIKGSPVKSAVERICTGIEVPLPSGLEFLDKDGHPRTNVRIRWWENSEKMQKLRYLALLDDETLASIPDISIPAEYRVNYAHQSPLFIGHYWLSPDTPKQPLTPYIACLDYSAGVGGPLVAYRGDSKQQTLDKNNFITVSSNPN